MEIEWVEDFLSLVDVRSFSRAAKLRHVSQPAFSRRIQALEAWIGVELVNRASKPLALTAGGRAFRGFAASIVRQIYHARQAVRGERGLPEREIQFAVAYTLALTFFPDWFAGLHRAFGEACARVSEMNVMDGAMALIAGEVDFLVCYHHPQLPVLLDQERYPYISLGRESMQAYSACNQDGQALYQLPGTSDQPLPCLSYTPGTFFVHVVDMLLLKAPEPYYLEPCYQSQMSEALKAMVVAGNGIGWLPEKCVQRELLEGKIAVAGSEKWRTELEIRIVCASENRRPVVTSLWNFLVAHRKPES